MERIDTINLQRLQWCCDDHGIALEELAKAANVAFRALSKLVARESGLTYRQLRKIADYFGRGVLFFLEPGPVNEKRVHSPQFRTLTNQQPTLSPGLRRLIERVERQRDLFLSLREDVDNREFARFAPPDLPKNSPKRAAAMTRAWLGLGEKNSFSSYREAVENKGVLVFRSNGYAGDWQIPKESAVSGFSLYKPECPVIVVKKQDQETRQAFTLMHELGHVLLHKRSFIDNEETFYNRQGKERDANAFAGHLLVPDDFLNRIPANDFPGNDPKRYNDWLATPSKSWGVSIEVILRRLMDGGRLSEKRYSDYRRWKQSLPKAEDSNAAPPRVWRFREPRNIFGEPFVQTVLDALQRERITLAKASSYLDNLSIDNVHKLEASYA